MFVEMDDEKRKQLILDLSALERLWAISGNPLHMWGAIMLLYRLDGEYPKWIKEYLGVAALQIRAKYIAYCGYEEIGNEARLIGEVLGFTNLSRKQGRGSCFEEQRTFEIDEDIFDNYLEAIKSVKKPELAQKAVADQLGVSPSTVWRACKRIDKFIHMAAKLNSKKS